MDKYKEEIINILNILHELVSIYKKTFKDGQDIRAINFNYIKYIRDDGTTDIFKYLSILADTRFIILHGAKYPCITLSLEIKAFLLDEEVEELSLRYKEYI